MTTLNLVETEAFIDGLWIEGDETFEVTNPADGTVIAKVADLGPGETRVAIEAAHRAFPTWAAKTAKERGAILRKTARSLGSTTLVTYEQQVAQRLFALLGGVKHDLQAFDHRPLPDHIVQPLGAQLFVESLLLPAEFGAKLASLSGPDFELRMVSSRGVVVWPKPAPAFDHVGFFRARFVARAD